MIIEKQRLYTRDMGGVLNVLVGCGLTGSNVAELLARSGADKFVLIDKDKVEKGNLPGQAYGLMDVRKDKVSALAEALFAYGDHVDVITHPAFLEVTNIAGLADMIKRVEKTGLVVYSFADSMKARMDTLKLFKLVSGDFPEAILVETRISKISWQAYVLRGLGGVEKYETTLYSDEEASQVPACEDGYNLAVVMGCVSRVVREVTFPEKNPKEYDFIVDGAIGDDKEDLWV